MLTGVFKLYEVIGHYEDFSNHYLHAYRKRLHYLRLMKTFSRLKLILAKFSLITYTTACLYQEYIGALSIPNMSLRTTSICYNHVSLCAYHLLFVSEDCIDILCILDITCINLNMSSY